MKILKQNSYLNLFCKTSLNNSVALIRCRKFRERTESLEIDPNANRNLVYDKSDILGCLGGGSVS